MQEPLALWRLFRRLWERGVKSLPSVSAIVEFRGLARIWDSAVRRTIRSRPSGLRGCQEIASPDGERSFPGLVG